ncbi:hypothetical protein FF38_03472 [Lucilia cuprina]|uniref:Uncharacterized protein n=1 Tax=Lucilia cuprina TaxID=7375 RepID=A0A0L0C665_LUCCU|nr:hypothetical protein FF38_03472 [Lucilia cuprina]
MSHIYVSPFHDHDIFELHHGKLHRLDCVAAGDDVGYDNRWAVDDDSLVVSGVHSNLDVDDVAFAFGHDDDDDAAAVDDDDVGIDAPDDHDNCHDKHLHCHANPLQHHHNVYDNVFLLQPYNPPDRSHSFAADNVPHHCLALFLYAPHRFYVQLVGYHDDNPFLYHVLLLHRHNVPCVYVLWNVY